MKNTEFYKKFAEVPTRPGRGGIYSYIRWQAVADRMNEIFGSNWSSKVVYQEIVNSNIVIRLRVSIMDVKTGNEYYQEGFGGAVMDDRHEAGNPFKSAYSKALKDACKKWGIALYIDEDDPTETGSKQDSVPLPPVVKNTNSTSTGAVSKSDSIPTVPPIPTVPAIDKPFKTKNTVPPDLDFLSSIPVENKTTGGSKQVPVMPKANTMVGAANISDVQLAALQSILNIQGVKYEELVKKAFAASKLDVSDPVPIMENLSYKEAVIVVKYGNDQHRRS